MAKFHVTDDGVRPCVASERACMYGDGDHFTSERDAQREFVSRMEEQYGVVRTVSERDVLEDAQREIILSTASESRAGYDKVSEVLQERLRKTAELAYRLRGPMSYTRRKKCKAELEAFRDKNAHFVEALENSPHRNEPAYENLNLSKVGNLVETTSFEPNTQEWLDARGYSLGGSDVGSIVEYDFLHGNDRKPWTDERFEEIRRIKNGEEKLQALDVPVGKGAFYRGNVWEDKIRDEFAKENPGLRVVNTKSQYTLPDNPAVQINVDGLVCDESDNVVGVVEIKTGSYAKSWEKGVPLGYRAQTLYYLENIGVDKAYVRAKINDVEDFTYVIHRGDPIVEGDSSSPTMRKYMNTRLLPLFNSWQNERAEREGRR